MMVADLKGSKPNPLYFFIFMQNYTRMNEFMSKHERYVLDFRASFCFIYLHLKGGDGGRIF